MDGKPGPHRLTVMAADVDMSGPVPRIGTPKALFTVRLAAQSANLEGAAFDVAPDGKRFLVNSMDQAPTVEPINLILNWNAELKK